MADKATAKPGGASTTREPRRKQELLDIASDVIAAKGYDAASIQDIADAMGVLKGSIYYYIVSKEELLYEILLDVHNRIDSQYVRLATGDATYTDKISQMVGMHVREIATNLPKAKIFMASYQSLTGPRREDIKKRRDESETLVRTLIAAGQSAGEFDPDLDPEVAAMAFLGTLNWMVRWYDPAGRLSIDTIAEQLSQYIVNGLRLNPPSGKAAPI